MSDRGFSLLEMLVVVAIVLLVAAVATPTLRAYSQEAHLVGAGRVFLGQFRLARQTALRTGVDAAIRFEPGEKGIAISVYVDGNHNGVLSADIRTGVDRRIAGPRLLDTGAGDVRVGINPGVPAIPPDTGVLDPADPIRFGRSDILTFTPLGTATPGTFYLAGRSGQAAVRVTPGSARARLMVFHRGRWEQK